jgi:hypothetical protein
LRYAIASTKSKKSYNTSLYKPYHRITNLPYTYIFNGQITTTAESNTTEVLEEVPLVEKDPILVKREEIKQELQVIDASQQSELREDEQELFAREIREQKKAEAEAKRRGIKLPQKKELADYFKLKDFDKWFKYKVGYSNSVEGLTKRNVAREYVKATVMMSPMQYFFINATFNKDINGFKNIYYQPDFSYSFGYSDWHPDTWSLVYSNYANNKFNPKEGEERFNFDQGTWELKYKTKKNKYNLSGALRFIPKNSVGSLVFNGSRSVKSDWLEKDILLSSNLKFYLDTNQQRLTLSSKAFLYKKFFVSSSVYLYADYSKQTALEPDYAYSFGWVDTSKGGLSITYSNYYTPTRWGWRDEEGPTFSQGSLSVSVNF